MVTRPETTNCSTTQNGLLAGDIGATKTSLALYTGDRNFSEPHAEITVSNDTVAGIEEIIEGFLAASDIQPDAACFGVAGPVSNNRVKMTNLDWTLDGSSLQKRFGMRSVTLVNDLVATAMGAVHLPADRLLTINAGHPDPVGAVGVIAPGTGLGEAFLIRHRDSWLPISSEGGHTSFAPTDNLQIRLLNFMSQQHRHVSTEMVCSGRGIPNLYEFLCAENGVKSHLRDNPDPNRIIVETALAALENNNLNDIACMTIQLFTAILASEAANLALKILATGGLYIGGGIPPRILPFLQTDWFMQAFAKAEYREMLASIPVHIILEPKTALIGAAACGLELPLTSGEAS